MLWVIHYKESPMDRLAKEGRLFERAYCQQSDLQSFEGEPNDGGTISASNWGD